MLGGWKRFTLWMALFGNGYSDTPTPHPGSDLLMEDSSFLLLEDGSSTIQLEV